MTPSSSSRGQCPLLSLLSAPQTAWKSNSLRTQAQAGVLPFCEMESSDPSVYPEHLRKSGVLERCCYGFIELEEKMMWQSTQDVVMAEKSETREVREQNDMGEIWKSVASGDREHIITQCWPTAWSTCCCSPYWKKGRKRLRCFPQATSVKVVAPKTRRCTSAWKSPRNLSLLNRACCLLSGQPAVSCHCSCNL